MQLDTLIFDPSVCGFPKPHLPLLPTGFDGIAIDTARSPWATADHFRHFSHGRYALREAYRLSGIGPNSTLLAPAYHCRTMIDPAISLGGHILLYPLKPDLTPDIVAIKALVAASRVPIKAVLATHFFGIPKQFDQLSLWCVTHNISLIEDGSHAFLTEQYLPSGIGIYGDFVISSPYKFLPSPDGGLLYARNATRLDTIRPSSPSWLAELRGIFRLRSKLVEHLSSRRALDVHTAVVRSGPTGIYRREAAGCSSDYRPTEENCASLRTSRYFYRHGNIEQVIQQRRINYETLANATISLPYCQPLYPRLPIHCTPYMFPLVVNSPETHFYALKYAGLPIWRWDTIVASECPTANKYRLHLLHLPCHQSITNAEMTWMINVLKAASHDDTQETRG